jgi:uncharacterized protein VirK/YbjX
MSLLDLEETCRTDVAARLSTDARTQHAEDSRHFWYNGEFQPHVGRTITHISKAPMVELVFRRDNYIVTTPAKAGLDLRIDPEVTVAALIEHLNSQKLIGQICCYETLDNRGVILKPDKTLIEQNVLPWHDSAQKEKAHITVRLQSQLMRKAIVFVVISGLAGLLIGWLCHRQFAP